MRLVVYHEMTIDDAVNIANAASDSLARHADEDMRDSRSQDRAAE